MVFGCVGYVYELFDEVCGVYYWVYVVYVDFVGVKFCCYCFVGCDDSVFVCVVLDELGVGLDVCCGCYIDEYVVVVFVEVWDDVMCCLVNVFYVDGYYVVEFVFGDL